MDNDWKTTATAQSSQLGQPTSEPVTNSAPLNDAESMEAPPVPDRIEIPASLPDIPSSSSLDFDLSRFIPSSDLSSTPVTDKVNKRASNVQKLAEENEKLKEELRAMSDRLEQAERRTQRRLQAKEKLDHKEQHIMDV
ncbi:hypothetical protein CYLTODRAFT_488461 [Cylindrobasidium torrendii FP15055 ss-10]|uniref:Uncharacterized protein n=1 Tax=Cylindrobasidium torrendii FP15055 ss-10 TaxID=1314674 RepID=A0A0D7BIC1_9AGAR|nr:hypothetical protein CYLTODRAFT_488461 [Cylindrobasidium torrendii FP15055 ss-10]